ncbi:hypothetical protein [Pirellulimonas nuda]|uniref:hypothetical protein n=1 Tax=Pirellulimonas nuda TaxID=2528009 RepID=UPI0011A828E1|nr:hypothetical protein [Pirellulimonas nuda]
MLTENTSTGRNQQVLQFAQRLFNQQPDWVTFFREVLGIDGLARRTFASFDELTAFERSEEYAEVQRMLVKLREQKPTADADSEPTRVITVRLPKSMHEYLRTEAHDLRTSMNKLCISKLLQVIEQDMIPTEQTAPPKRRTTPEPSVASNDSTPAAGMPAASTLPMTPPKRETLPPQPQFTSVSTTGENGHYNFKGGF